MSYIIKQPNGTVIITLPDGTADGPDVNPGLNATDVNLIGHNYPGYGQIQNENFIDLLQNFANTVPPTNPLIGELWYDISTSFLKVYNGTSFVSVSPLVISATTPSQTILGVEWWDTVNQQLKIYNGSNWALVGPPYSILNGISGVIVENVLDTGNNSHTVLKVYVNNVVTSIVSNDAAFTPLTAITGFTTINQGQTLSNVNGKIFGTITNAEQLGNIAAVNFARKDITTTFAANIAIGGGNLGITARPDGHVSIINTVQNANIAFYSNVAGVTIKPLEIIGSSGLIKIAGDPTTALGIATKNYVDTVVSTTAAPLANIASPAFTGTPIAPTASVTANTAQIATTQFVQTALGSNTKSYIDSSIATAVAPLANIASPAFTGTPTAPTASVTANTIQIATTQFVQTALGSNTKSYVDTSIATAVAPLAPASNPTFTGTPLAPNIASTANTAQIATTNFVQITLGTAAKTYIDSSIATAVAPLANIVGPALTGTPTAPTASVTANSTQIATTQFVQTTLGSNTKSYVDTSIATAIAPLAPASNPTFTGTPLAPNIASTANTAQIATTNFVQITLGTAAKTYIDSSIATAVAPLANIVSPALTGTPTAPTASVTANTAQLATTQFVQTTLGSNTKTYIDNSISTATSPLATILSPAFTGIPTAANAATGTNTAQLATTAFVQTTVASTTSALWKGSNKFINTTPGGTPDPTQGQPGDFWFQL